MRAPNQKLSSICWLVSGCAALVACSAESGPSDEPAGESSGESSGDSSGDSTGNVDTPVSGGSSGTGGATGSTNASGGSSMSTGGANSSVGSGGMGSGAGGDSTQSSGGQAAMNASGGFTGTCTDSMTVEANATGTGPHKVVIETNSDDGIDEGTIYRPEDLGGDEKYPIFVWGEGACSQNGLSNRAAMTEIASHGYFVVADGTPGGQSSRGMDRNMLAAMGAPLLAYVDWAIAENDKPCSAYYRSLQPTKVASNGFSCGGLMAQGTVSDPRIVTWGVTSSGMAGADKAFYDSIHTPVLFVEGSPAEVAYDGAKEGFGKISELDVPVVWFSSKSLDHGGDLGARNGGDFTKLNLAWLNWWLKDDLGATGKGFLVGPDCPLCSDSGWEYLSAHVP